MLGTRSSSTHIAIHQQIVKPDRCACALLLLFKYAGKALANLLGSLHESFDLYLFICLFGAGRITVEQGSLHLPGNGPANYAGHRDATESRPPPARLTRNTPRSETLQTVRSGVGVAYLLCHLCIVYISIRTQDCRVIGNRSVFKPDRHAVLSTIVEVLSYTSCLSASTNPIQLPCGSFIPHSYRERPHLAPNLSHSLMPRHFPNLDT